MKSKILILFFLISIKSLGQKQVEVFFDFNKDFPNAASILEINEWISKNKDVEITKLQGFCDSIDTKNYNIKLSERRIENVQILLDKSGLKFSKELHKVAFGKEFKQSKIQAENRKVIIFYNEATILPIESELTKRIKSSKVGEYIALPNIYFFNNSARIVPKSEPTLYDLRCAMEENPKLKIEIQGHICCQTFGDPANTSTARARAIYNYLLRNKINKNRMTFKGFGTTKPIHPIPEKNAQQEDENRRVEILILQN
ncbi:OmpA family protein [Flavobacterium sp.]|uniref:OmpA family protein n=1 Tax=Flavobacterium sp. TaxID=239 RepID=UPI0024878470|nr:OmpA family protein [Flavobacterium sp.]MDI1316923.1 OmpA family protein [Flavobacterium sp.]